METRGYRIEKIKSLHDNGSHNNNVAWNEGLPHRFKHVLYGFHNQALHESSNQNPMMMAQWFLESC